jgi:hypothetical protein
MKRKRFIKKKDNLILSLVNLTFFTNWTLFLLHTLIVLYKFYFIFLMWRNVQFKGPICFKLVHGILDPGSSSKVALSFNPLSIANVLFCRFLKKKSDPVYDQTQGSGALFFFTLRITLMTDVTKLGTLPAWLGTSASMAWHMDLDMDSHMACL